MELSDSKGERKGDAWTFCYSANKVYDPKLITCSETSSYSLF